MVPLTAPTYADAFAGILDPVRPLLAALQPYWTWAVAGLLVVLLAFALSGLRSYARTSRARQRHLSGSCGCTLHRNQLEQLEAVKR